MRSIAAGLRRPVAAALVTVAALVPVALPTVTGAAPACAVATGPHAALVIDTGAGTRSFCVALDASSVSGIHLIELAGAQDHLEYGFGSGGQAVCRLAGVGPQGDDCFADYPEYWGYWHGDGHGGWTWSASGAASARVGDDGLDAWVWGSGDSGATHRRPGPIGLDDVCVPVASPATSPSPARSTPGAAIPSSGTPSSSPDAAPSHPGTTRSVKPSNEGIVKTSPPARPPTAGALAAGPGPPPASSGPGPGLLIALVLGAALAGGGWLRARSSHRRSAG